MVPKALVLVNVFMKRRVYKATKFADDSDFFNVVKTSESQRAAGSFLIRSG